MPPRVGPKVSPVIDARHMLHELKAAPRRKAAPAITMSRWRLAAKGWRTVAVDDPLQPGGRGVQAPGPVG